MTDTTVDKNRCQHTWGPHATTTMTTKYTEVCAGCGARCTRDKSGQIVEYDRGVKLPDRKRD